MHLSVVGRFFILVAWNDLFQLIRTSWWPRLYIKRANVAPSWPRLKVKGSYCAILTAQTKCNNQFETVVLDCSPPMASLECLWPKTAWNKILKVSKIQDSHFDCCFHPCESAMIHQAMSLSLLLSSLQVAHETHTGLLKNHWPNEQFYHELKDLVWSGSLLFLYYSH